MEKVLRQAVDILKASGQQNIAFLDIGAGTGFWTELITNALVSEGFQVDASALDISSDALDVINERLPQVHGIKEDLAAVSPDKFCNSYALVSAFYCFHHLVRSKDFINAFRFAGSSVRNGGWFLVMDPVLTRPYSKFDVHDYYAYKGNGIPRHLYFVDDILAEVGLKRWAIQPAVSFVLNGCVEAPGPGSYFIMSKSWELLGRLFRSERATQTFSRIFVSLDEKLKQSNHSFSSSVCLYRKEL